MDDGFFYPFLPEWLDMLLSMVTIIMVPVAVIVVLVGMWRKVFNVLWYVFSLQPLRRRQKRHQLQQGLEYYRDLPADGNLKIANAVMNSLSSALVTDYQGLFGALILRLVDKGALVMELKSTVYGSEPHMVLSIGKTLKDGADMTERLFCDMLAQAAGSDGVLQPRELQRYMRKNKDMPFFMYIEQMTADEKSVAANPDTARQVLGLKKFLLDFSLIGIHSINELPLWREYLVYATLFGIADQVSADFGKLYPDYFKANALALTQLNIVGNKAMVTYTNAMVKGMD